MSNVRFRYQTIELGDNDFHLRTLRDLQQCTDDLPDASDTGISSATWPLFGVLWESEELLSSLMITEDVQNLRILEVGCGTALASIVLQKRGADITATDYNPDVAAYLTTNTELNNLDPIACVCTNWNDTDPELGLFDLIIGSDLLYDHHNIEPLVGFLQEHAKQDCAFIIVDPQRGQTAPFIRMVRELGFVVEVTRTPYTRVGDPEKDYLIIRCHRH